MQIASLSLSYQACTLYIRIFECVPHLHTVVKKKMILEDTLTYKINQLQRRA